MKGVPAWRATACRPKASSSVRLALWRPRAAGARGSKSEGCCWVRLRVRARARARVRVVVRVRVRVRVRVSAKVGHLRRLAPPRRHGLVRVRVRVRVRARMRVRARVRGRVRVKVRVRVLGR